MEVTDDILRELLDGKRSLPETVNLSLVVFQNNAIRSRAEAIILLTDDEQQRRNREKIFRELEELEHHWRRDILAAIARSSAGQDPIKMPAEVEGKNEKSA